MADSASRSTDWNPALYTRFVDYRTQPAIDLAARVRHPSAERIVDLGCGPGNSTAVLAQRWPKAQISGVDRSPTMLEQARADQPTRQWVHSSIEEWEPEAPVDILFANASVQWISGHELLFPRLVGFLREGGALAVQMPYHHSSSLHSVLQAASLTLPDTDRFKGARSALEQHPSSFYYDLLVGHCDHIDIWETEYLHVMDGPEAIVAWISSTGMRPYLEMIADEAEEAVFRRAVLDGYARAFPPRADGCVLMPFRRQFVIGYSKSGT